VQQLSRDGEPIYGVRDDADLGQMADMGVPFWLAGGYASREKFRAALAAGAHGVQVGTAFAFCEESGLDPTLRRQFLAGVLQGERSVFTDPAASPTSFPFKVAAARGRSRRPPSTRQPRGSAISGTCVALPQARRYGGLPLPGGACGRVRAQGRQG
jgi:nitronate monooxygenase